MIDSARAIETPEGVLLELRLAGPPARALAWFIDMIIRIAVYIITGMILGMTTPFLGHTGVGIGFIAIFLMEWFYPVVFEVLAKGQTVGKMVLGIRVLCDDGTPVSWSHSMVRSLLMFVDFMPVLYGAGLLSMLIQQDFKRLGDLAAGTLVVYAEKRKPRRTNPNQEKRIESVQDTRELLPVPLTPEEQQSLVAFAERTRELTTERAEELADILEPLTGQHGAKAVARICRLASSYAGDK